VGVGVGLAGGVCVADGVTVWPGGGSEGVNDGSVGRGVSVDGEVTMAIAVVARGDADSVIGVTASEPPPPSKMKRIAAMSRRGLCVPLQVALHRAGALMPPTAGRLLGVACFGKVA
jgi:hypothetical protein